MFPPTDWRGWRALNTPSTYTVVFVAVSAALIFYFANLETVPVSGRTRFNVYSGESVKKAGEMEYKRLLCTCFSFLTPCPALILCCGCFSHPNGLGLLMVDYLPALSHGSLFLGLLTGHLCSTPRMPPQLTNTSVHQMSSKPRASASSASGTRARCASSASWRA